MSKRYSGEIPNRAVIPTGNTPLPTEEPIAVYYRQSTEGQVGNISTTIQTVDMVEYLKARGWAEDKVIMLDMDAGISGKTKIDERPGMKILFDLITRSKIKAVACQDEDRLFRDVTQIQVNIFIEACRAANVLVITPSMIYDFSNELTGVFHARQFRFKSEMAAEYLTSVVMGKLNRAKQHLIFEGRWAGGLTPVGYMVDMRRTLPDGSKNENWRRYTSFEPYAEVVNEYFKLFLSFGGNLRATVRYIHAHGPYYPDPQTCLPPTGFMVDYRRLQRYSVGFCPTRSGLQEMFAHAAYIGHWMYKGSIVRWNNHQAIVPLKNFMRAFNYLSAVALDGQENKHYHPYRENARPSRDEKRPMERPLYAGMVVSQFEGQWKNVGVKYSRKHYEYVLYSTAETDTYIWSRKAAPLDSAITKFVREKLQATFDSKVWEKMLAKLEPSHREERRSKEAQIAALERVMENQISSIDGLSNFDMIKGVQARYEEAQTEHRRLTSELARMDQEFSNLTAAFALRDECGPALDNWENLSRNEKRVISHRLIRQIEITALGLHETLVIIRWKDGKSSKINLFRRTGKGQFWTPQEQEALISLIENDASGVEYLAALPSRTMASIKRRVRSLKGDTYYIKAPGIPDNATYANYMLPIVESDETGIGISSASEREASRHRPS